MSRWMEIGEKLVFLTEMDEDSVDADPEIWDPDFVKFNPGISDEIIKTIQSISFIYYLYECLHSSVHEFEIFFLPLYVAFIIFYRGVVLLELVIMT